MKLVENHNAKHFANFILFWNKIPHKDFTGNLDNEVDKILIEILN